MVKAEQRRAVTEAWTYLLVAKQAMRIDLRSAARRCMFELTTASH